MTKTSVQYLTITEDTSGQRIDNFLMTYLKGVPKTRIYRILRKGEIRVNKKRIQPSYRLQSGDQIRLPPLEIDKKIEPGSASLSLKKFLETRIIFEDKNLFIINKPSGIPVHGGSRVKLGMIEVLRQMYPRLLQLELAHRLDADTSGCLILAKKRSILREIHELLREGKIRKIYHALTKGHWKNTELVVQESLKKSVLNGGERVVRVHPEGKPSVTRFKCLAKYAEASLMEANLETGRTHQIRVHAQYRGHSLAGDEKYGDTQFNKTMRGLGLKRLFLHAYSIEFTLPSTGEHVSLTAPLDPELTACLKALE